MAKKKAPELVSDIIPVIDPTLCDLLADMLEKANAGEIHAIAIAYVNPKGESTTAYSMGNHKFTLIGASSWLHSRLLDTTREGNQG